MGVRDSSRTRVAPVFDRLFAIDPSGADWLPGLLGLVNGPPACGNLVEARWWPTEKCLFPPLGLLEWLVQNLQEPENQIAWGTNPDVKEKRKRLIARDRPTVSEALSELQAGRTYGGWAVLEGPSYPDVFLSTKDTLIVVEGKRTERGPTKNTTWMRGRHQILRHLDAAFEVIEGRRLLGLMVVEGDSAGQPPPIWSDYLAEVRSPVALQTALPHRTDEQREAIRTALLGVTTWQAICARLQIPNEVLIPEVRTVESDPDPLRVRSGLGKPSAEGKA